MKAIKITSLIFFLALPYIILRLRSLPFGNDQLEVIVNMGKGNENELSNLPKLFDSMKKAWRKGDNAQLRKIALDPWIGQFPGVYNSLLVNRNNNWIPKIEEMLRTKETELILFGAMHLIGEDGILKQLEDKGYTIESI